MIFSLQVSSDNEIQNIMANEARIHEPNFAQANIITALGTICKAMEIKNCFVLLSALALCSSLILY